MKGAALQVASGFAYLGDVDEALTWLERAVDQHKRYLRAPAYRVLWPEPRFQALWKKVGLPGKPGDPPPGAPPSG